MVLDVIKPTYQTCVRFYQKKFWDNVIVSKELSDFMENTISNIEMMDSLYWVVGRRGSGKSQVLEIVARKCIEKFADWGVLPIIVGVSGLPVEPSPDYVLKKLCSSIAKELIYLKDHFNEAIQNSNADYSSIKKRWNISFLLNSLHEYRHKYQPEKFDDQYKLDELLSQFGKGKITYLLLVDELDKMKANSYTAFLTHNQNFFSHLVDMNAKMLISGGLDFFALLTDDTNIEINYFLGKHINPPSIDTPEICKKLIDTRISMKNPRWVSPFDTPSYSIIRAKCNGIPRDILRHTGIILEKGKQKKLNKIHSEFVNEYFEYKEKDEKFEMEVKKELSKNTELKILLMRLSEDSSYSRIVNAFQSNPNAARREDFSVIQSLGVIGLDEASYKLKINEMRRKELLKDRGFGPFVNPILEEYLNRIEKEFYKNSINLFETIQKVEEGIVSYGKPTVKKGKTIDEKIREKSLNEIIKDILKGDVIVQKNEILGQLENYQSGDALKKWEKSLGTSLENLVKKGDIIKIEDRDNIHYAPKIEGMNVKIAREIGDLSLLVDIYAIHDLIWSDSEKDRAAGAKKIRNIVEKKIIEILQLDKKKYTHEEIIDKLSLWKKENAVLYYKTNLQADRDKDYNLVFSTSLRLLTILNQEVEKKKQIKHNVLKKYKEIQSELTDNKIIALNDFSNNFKKNIPFLDFLVDNHMETVIPVGKNDIKINLKKIGIKKGFHLKCRCGIKIFSGLEDVYHIECKKNENIKLEKIQESYIYEDKFAPYKVVSSKIDFIIKKIEEISNQKITKSYYKNNNYGIIALINYSNSILILAEKQKNKKYSKYEYINWQNIYKDSIEKKFPRSLYLNHLLFQTIISDNEKKKEITKSCFGKYSKLDECKECKIKEFCNANLLNNYTDWVASKSIKHSRKALDEYIRSL